MDTRKCIAGAVVGLVMVLFLPTGAKSQERPSETYWHIISASGKPMDYLQYAGLSAEEITKVLPVLAEYEGKYQNLRDDYNALSGEEQVNGAQARFLVAKAALATEYDARLTGLLSQRGLIGLQKRIGEVAANTRVISMTPRRSMLTPANYHIHADMGLPNCHPSFHYSHSWALAFVNPDPVAGTPGSMTITSTAHGYTSIAYNSCNTTHQGHAKTAIDTQAPNEQYGYAAATAQMQVSASSTLSIGAAGTDPIFSDTGVPFWQGGSVHCPVFGFIAPWNWSGGQVQVEFANTTSQVEWSTKGINGDGHAFYNAHQVCPAGDPVDTPPDFPGPDIVFDIDPISTGYVRVQDFCWRWNPNWSGTFNGILWSSLNVPRYGYFSYVQFIGTVYIARCTKRDTGSMPSF